MRKVTLATLLLIAVAGGGLTFAVLRPLNRDLAIVRELSEKFLEDLQFKDFRSSSLYSHVLDLHRIDIGRAIEELFLVKPEFLDLMDYRISRAELDSDGTRARVIMTTRYKLLNRSKEPKEADIVLYWARRHPDCPLGASCDAGSCVDESGKKLLRPVGEGDEEAQRRKRNPTADLPAESSDTPYTCDSTLEEKWYMNLDSTLKQKDYR